MAPTKGTAGSMQDDRIVINGGMTLARFIHPGFGAYDWTKTKDNPKGMSEYDFNKESSAILGALVEYAACAIYVHQDDFIRPILKRRICMVWLQRWNQSSDIMISNHNDDDRGIKPAH